MKTKGQTWRRVRASWRDTLLLLREFRLPLLWFAMVILSSGSVYYLLSQESSQPARGLAHGIYITMLLTFLQPPVDFPAEWYLQSFFFLMPVVGIGILAQGLTEFGVMLFNRRARGKEWEMAVASTYTNHVVLIGLGHLGYRVVKKLFELEQDVVAIEKTPDTEMVANVRQMGVPVIHDDGTREGVLLNAGIARARAVILCTQNDSMNLRMALKARSLNPKIEVVIRIFDDEFATSLQTQFGFHAMSATSMAAPLFAAIAAHVDITPPINIEGKPHVLANVQVGPGSRLQNRSVIEVEETFRVSIVLLCAGGKQQFHPPGETRIQSGQTVAIFGEPDLIYAILHENHE
jgi:Trk K+ transport system NAD-binding subunit